MPKDQQMHNLLAVVPFAQLTQRRWHVPASISLAQWIFESGWGQDEIALRANNCFGIKHLQANYTEKYMEFRTQEYARGATVPHVVLADFVQYVSVAASFEAHGRLLGSSARYTAALAYLPDIAAYARHLQMAGYSTNPKYAAMLLAEIAQLDLTQFDRFPTDSPTNQQAA